MRFNMEINFQNKLDMEKYIQVKTKAYLLSDALTKDQIVEIASKYEISDPEERVIYISTLLYPNDAKLIELLYNNMQSPELLKIPKTILEAKSAEYIKYNLPEILEQNPSLRQYSNYKTKFEDDSATEEIINSRLK